MMGDKADCIKLQRLLGVLYKTPLKDWWCPPEHSAGYVALQQARIKPNETEGK